VLRQKLELLIITGVVAELASKIANIRTTLFMVALCVTENDY